jgi:hypothetical protein
MRQVPRDGWLTMATTFNEAKAAAEKLHALFQDAHPGLPMWRSMVRDQILVLAAVPGVTPRNQAGLQGTSTMPKLSLTFTREEIAEILAKHVGGTHGIHCDPVNVRFEIAPACISGDQRENRPSAELTSATVTSS